MPWCGQCQFNEYFLKEKKCKKEWNMEKERERKGRGRKGAKDGVREDSLETSFPLSSVVIQIKMAP